MKILKLLNKKNLSIILSFFFLFTLKVYSTEPVDIWNVDIKEITTENSTEDKNIEDENISESSIYEMQLEKKKEFEIQEEETLFSKKIEIAGLYDPAENGLTIDMWSNSNGKQILKLLNKIKEIKLSNDAKEILNILLLTNSYFPQQDISNEQFLKLKLDWLIRNDDFQLMENYLIKNQNVNKNEQLIIFMVDEYLSRSEIEKSCEIFSKIKEAISNNYLSKFHIYCLINTDRKEEAQLQFDIKKELGFKDDFFEKKFDYLMGYNLLVDETISEKSILDFHLSHITNPNFIFEPDNSTSKNIWRYLSSSNLLTNIESIDLEDKQKIISIEKATHEGNYTEKELFDLYKRFQFNINQLLNVERSYKLLSEFEGRALLYQGILLTTDVDRKLELIKILKDSFIKDGNANAFNNQLASILKKIKEEDVPSNYSSFYNKNIKNKKSDLKKIKINNKVIHQSKLINYLREDIKEKNIQKSLNDILKKTKKNKKYFVSTKDVILLESLKSDGIKFDKKYESLYEINNSNMPNDIKEFIENNEPGLVLLRLVQILGQDNFEDLGSETLFFIISALNQLNIDKLRNKILLKVLPLKV